MRLGEAIIRELGLERSNDTLSRWLAHHVAELILAARTVEETGTREQGNHAGQQCRTAILELWQHRSAWPRGWPPPRAVQVTELLDEVPEPGSDAWHRPTLLSNLQDDHYRLLSALIDLTSFDSDTTVEQRWLDEFGEMLTPDEATILARIIDTPRRLALLPNLTDSREDEGGGRDTKHPALVLADAYRDAVYAVVERSDRVEREEPDELDEPSRGEP